MEKIKKGLEDGDLTILFSYMAILPVEGEEVRSRREKLLCDKISRNILRWEI
jgi:hypothetical protein